ncbi:MAG: mandelate racemase family protein [Devosia sp.]
MKIVDVTVRVFRYTTRKVPDSAGHSHPGPETPAQLALLTIVCDDGSEGHHFSAPEPVRPFLIEKFVKKVLLGQNPFDRERLWQDLAHWQRGSGMQLSDRTLAIVDAALWDLAGRKLGLPVHKLIGAYRDSVPAYASTMCGDDIPGGLATPEDYARFAEQLVARGYKGIKLHTWMPPLAGAPDVKRDLTACAAVREAVGPDIALMLDPYHWYSRMEAYELGRGLEKLGFAWFEEPMEEDSIASYAWLTENLDIPILGPESAGGKNFSRADWILYKACDILRSGPYDVGGITPAIKSMHLAEAFGMDCEVHGNGIVNLICTAIAKNCRWYERGLLHPHFDYDSAPAYLKAPVDPLDADGNVPLPTLPGLGQDIDFDYIDAHLLG